MTNNERAHLIASLEEIKLRTNNPRETNRRVRQLLDWIANAR